MKKLVLVVIMLLCSVAVSNATTLDGTLVQGYYFFPSLSTQIQDLGTIVAGSGTPFINVGTPGVNLYVTDTQIIADYSQTTPTSSGTSWNGPANGDSSVSFNGFELVDTGANITSVTIDPSTNMSGLVASDISFTPNDIFVNWAGLPFDANTSVVLDVNGGTDPVPEPGTVILLGLGMAGLAVYSKHRKNSKA